MHNQQSNLLIAYWLATAQQPRPALLTRTLASPTYYHRTHQIPSSTHSTKLFGHLPYPFPNLHHQMLTKTAQMPRQEAQQVHFTLTLTLLLFKPYSPTQLYL